MIGHILGYGRIAPGVIDHFEGIWRGESEDDSAESSEKMSREKVLLTGASGSMGHEAFLELQRRKDRYDVNLLIRPSRVNKKMFARYEGEPWLNIVWGDLTDEGQVKGLVDRLGPDAIVHVAAIVAPTAYVIPDKAYGVNVNGTRYLVEAAQALGTKPRFVFTSSYSVHGPRNDEKDLPFFDPGKCAPAPAAIEKCPRNIIIDRNLAPPMSPG